MGQRVHPIGMRVGIIRDWDAKWYAEKEIRGLPSRRSYNPIRIRSKELADLPAVSTNEIRRAVKTK